MINSIILDGYIVGPLSISDGEGSATRFVFHIQNNRNHGQEDGTLVEVVTVARVECNEKISHDAELICTVGTKVRVVGSIKGNTHFMDSLEIVADDVKRM